MTRRMRYGFLVALALSSAAASGIFEDRGLEIVLEAERRDTGWGDCQARATMTLRNRHGDTSERVLRVRYLEGKDDGDLALVVMEKPADVKGTALLTHAHRESADDQWLYLPALKRVKRIAGANQSGSFMGSEFAYEDLSMPAVEKYSYEYLRDEDLDGVQCFVVARRPASHRSGYTREVVWLDQQAYRVFKVDYYDRKDALLKTLIASDYRLYGGGYWRAGVLIMSNHQTGKSTELQWEGITFGNGFTERDFDRNSLAQVK